MLARISSTFAFLALLVIVSGCGGGGSSSDEARPTESPGLSSEAPKEAFIEEADALCSDYQAKSQPVRGEIEAIERGANPESPENEARLGELLNEAIADAEIELESIRELEPPAADQVTIGKMLDTAQVANGMSVEAAAALETGETSGLGKLAKEIEATNNRAKGMAEGYGLKVCGQAP